MHLGVTGRRVIGKDLVKCGLATHFVEHKNIESLKKDLLANLNHKTEEREALAIIE